MPGAAFAPARLHPPSFSMRPCPPQREPPVFSKAPEQHHGQETRSPAPGGHRDLVQIHHRGNVSLVCMRQHGAQGTDSGAAGAGQGRARWAELTNPRKRERQCQGRAAGPTRAGTHCARCLYRLVSVLTGLAFHPCIAGREGGEEGGEEGPAGGGGRGTSGEGQEQRAEALEPGRAC